MPHKHGPGWRHPARQEISRVLGVSEYKASALIVRGLIDPADKESVDRAAERLKAARLSPGRSVLRMSEALFWMTRKADNGS